MEASRGGSGLRRPPYGTRRTVAGDALSAQLDGVIGTATVSFPRGNNVERIREVALGDLVADALRTTYGTQIAFTNGGGDGYVELADGQGTTRDLMAGDLVDYITAQGTISPTTDGRIDDIVRADA